MLAGVLSAYHRDVGIGDTLEQPTTVPQEKHFGTIICETTVTVNMSRHTPSSTESVAPVPTMLNISKSRRIWHTSEGGKILY